jgi:hypothetical protein
MNENAKKVAIVVAGIVALGVAGWQGAKFFTSSTPQYIGKPIGNYSAGHTGKGALMNTEKGGQPRDLGN